MLDPNRDQLCAEKGLVSVYIDVRSVTELVPEHLASLAEIYWLLCRQAGVSARQMLDDRVAELTGTIRMTPDGPKRW